MIIKCPYHPSLANLLSMTKSNVKKVVFLLTHKNTHLFLAKEAAKQAGYRQSHIESEKI